MVRVRCNRLLSLSLLAAGALVGEAIAQQRGEPMPYDQALARYQECLSRLPFQYHTSGRETLARTGSPDALTVLAKDYAKAKDYPEHSRYTLASMFGRFFRDEQFVPRFAEMRRKFDDPVDTWLWYHTLRNEISLVDARNAVRIATGAKKAYQRAAAILAIGDSSRPDLAAVVVPNCVEFPKKPGDRMLLLGAMTGALWRNKARVNEDGYRKALRAYISLLAADVRLSHSAKVQMARHLQTILNGPAQFVNPEPWLELLDRGEVKRPKSTHTVVKPRFFGIETEGERFCYVVDMSDSMLKEISPSARPKGPITGPKKKRKKKSMALDESDLPWHKIVTRWDLAREQLRISLSRLPKDKQFSIVWFGTDAGTLDATKGLVKATPANVKRAMAELDSINATMATAGRKQGQMVLRGETSLHFGMSVAFSLGKRGPNGEPSYVAPKPLIEGCDTVFLLSDGVPNWDGFDINDKDYGEGRVMRDVERGIAAARTPRINYPGPYASFPTFTGSGHRPRAADMDTWLIQDLVRQNAFRRIRIHCVGLGEANETLLETLAEIGHGEVFIVGKKK